MKSNYIKHKLANLITINKIVTIHYYELDRDFPVDGESHTFGEIIYVDSGKVEIMANNRHLKLIQADVVFHKPNEFHA